MTQLLKARVLSNQSMTEGVYRLVMEEKSLAAAAQPGQFLNIRVTSFSAPLLRRPISIHWVEADRVEILYQVVGKGTELLSGVQAGSLLDIQGPLGKGFRSEGMGKNEIRSKNVLIGEGDIIGASGITAKGELKEKSENRGKLLVVGGGIGIAPLGLLARDLDPKNTLCLLGARNCDTLMASGGQRLADLGYECKTATDDGSLGIKGLVTELLSNELAGSDAPRVACIYACGPKAMLREVARLAQNHNIPCQISLEEHMGCGVGACLGCVCKGVPKFGKEQYRKVCSDGPVFDAREVIWE